MGRRKRKSNEDKIDELLNGRGTAGEMAAAIIQEFGGLPRFAKEVFEEYHGSMKGSVARQRILLGVIALNTQADKMDAPENVQDFEDDELEEMVDRVTAKEQQASETAAPAKVSKPAADATRAEEETGRTGTSPG